MHCSLLVEIVTAQTTEFTYQGNLKNAAVPANGNHDFEFLLFDALTGGNQLGSTIAANNVAVTDGIFSVNLDFGNQFSGANRFLEIRVRASGQPALTLLLPRQLINSIPYSVKSLTAENANTATNAVNASTANNALQLGGVNAKQYVLTTDQRLSNDRNPTAGSSHYIHNSLLSQAGANFNVSGSGRAGVFDAITHYEIGGQRVLFAQGGFVNNTYLGFNTGGVVVSDNNSFFGSNAGAGNAGDGNTFLGTATGSSNGGGNNNTLLGSFANVGSGNLNFATAIGAGSTVGTNNTIAIGRSSGQDTVQVPGNLNVVGTFTGNIPAGSNHYIQNATTQQATSNFNISGNGAVGGTISGNIVNATTRYDIGGTRILDNDGTQNLFVGIGAGSTNTGTGNSFFGHNAGLFNAGGNFNTFVGSFAGGPNTSGSFNTVVGSEAGVNSSGSGNSFFGRTAGFGNFTGSNNTLVGFLSDVGSNNLVNAAAIGVRSQVNQSHSLVLGPIQGVNGCTLAQNCDTVNVGIGTTTPGARLHVVAPAGDNSVILPGNSIGPFEIFAEAGGASILNSGSIAMDGTVQTLLTRAFTVPAAGYVLVIGSLEATAAHTIGSSSIGVFGVSENAGAFPSNQDLRYTLSAALATGTYSSPITVHGLFQVAAGVNTFYLLGQEGTGSFSAAEMQLTLLYIPTVYGQVVPTAGAEATKETESVDIDDRVVQLNDSAGREVERQEAEIAGQRQLITSQQAQIEVLRKLVCRQYPKEGICRGRSIQ
jgi:hypothetical protein